MCIADFEFRIGTQRIRELDSDILRFKPYRLPFTVYRSRFEEFTNFLIN